MYNKGLYSFLLLSQLARNILSLGTEGDIKAFIVGGPGRVRVGMIIELARQ